MIHQPKPFRAKFAVLGLVISVALAFAAVAASSASALSVSGLSSHSGSGGLITISPANSFTRSCSSTSSTGKTTSSTTGEITFTFSGCRTNTQIGEVVCTGSGMASGTFKTATLEYKLVYLDDANTKPGLLLIPPGAEHYGVYPEPFGYLSNQLIPGSGTVANYSCGALGAIEWKGAFLAKIASPGLKTPTNSAKLEFGAAAGTHISGVKSLEYKMTEIRGSEKASVTLTGSHTLSSATTFELLP
jgi:hypothetical protein